MDHQQTVKIKPINKNDYTVYVNGHDRASAKWLRSPTAQPQLSKLCTCTNARHDIDIMRMLSRLLCTIVRYVSVHAKIAFKKVM